MTATADEAAAIAAALRTIFSRNPMERSTFMVDRRGLKSWRAVARHESIDTLSLGHDDRRDPWRDRR